MKMKTALLVSLLGAAWLASAAAAPVKTEGGLVEGTVADGLTIYRGIPFRRSARRRSALAPSSAGREVVRDAASG